MGWFSLIAIYFVIWWLCLFIVLPIGNRSQADDGEVTPGTEAGAPVAPHVWTKLAINTVAAAFVMGIVLWALSNPALQEYWR